MPSSIMLIRILSQPHDSQMSGHHADFELVTQTVLVVQNQYTSDIERDYRYVEQVLGEDMSQRKRSWPGEDFVVRGALER